MLTSGQRAVLNAGLATGMCQHYAWIVNGWRKTATVDSMLEQGLMTITYLGGGRAEARVTDAGREALKAGEEK
jgi:phosphosulfolactate phosphohydrolase-like enzyme